MKKKFTPNSTSWEQVSSWYDKAVGQSGHYYHDKVILPKLLQLLPTQKEATCSLLDLACGQGILSRHLPPSISYVGVDLAPSLIRSAQEKAGSSSHQFLTADITKPLPLKKTDFAFCTIILAIQNLEDPLKALQNASKHLASQGRLFLVLNHPCFRIPRQSSWEIDEEKQIQYRRVDRYASSLKIPIQSAPSQGNRSETTFSFHHSLATWSLWLKEAGFSIEELQEWYSDKKSTGKNAKREDRSRTEFPLFLFIQEQKKH